jgi:hypothetical protein
MSVQTFLLGIRRRRPNRILETPHIRGWLAFALPLRSTAPRGRGEAGITR